MRIIEGDAWIPIFSAGVGQTCLDAAVASPISLRDVDWRRRRLLQHLTKVSSAWFDRLTPVEKNICER